MLELVSLFSVCDEDKHKLGDLEDTFNPDWNIYIRVRVCVCVNAAGIHWKLGFFFLPQNTLLVLGNLPINCIQIICHVS